MLEAVLIFVMLSLVWPMVHTQQSDADGSIKVIWVTVLMLLPILGTVLWFFWGPRLPRNSAQPG